MEHEIEITVTEHGHDPDNGDRLVGGFHELNPDVDAVVDQNTKSGELTATFIIEAEGVEDAVKDGFVHFARAATRAGLEPTTVLSVRAQACQATAPDDELVPA